MYGIQLLATAQYMKLIGEPPSSVYCWVDSPAYPFAYRDQAAEVLQNQIGSSTYGANVLQIVDEPTAEFPAPSAKAGA